MTAHQNRKPKRLACSILIWLALHRGPGRADVRKTARPTLAAPKALYGRPGRAPMDDKGDEATDALRAPKGEEKAP